MPPDRHETQPSAEIVRVECAKCKRECDVSRSGATNCSVKEHLLSHGELLGEAAVTATKVLSTLVEGVDALNKTQEETNGLLRELVEGQKLALEKATRCGDRACRMREMQARVRFVPDCGQPSAEIARVECAKCRRECDLVLSRATLCGDRARRMREMQARLRFRSNPDRARRTRQMQARVRFVPVAGPSAEIARVECAKRRRECDLVLSGATLCGDRACRLCSTTLVRGAICGAGS